MIITFILMLQIDCTWGVVVLKKSQTHDELSFTSNDCENARRSKTSARAAENALPRTFSEL